MRYAAASYWRGGIYGETNPVVLVVGHKPTWLARYRTAIARLALPISIGFTGLDDIEHRDAVGAIWQAPTGDERYALRAITNLPYGKEPLAREISGKSSQCEVSPVHNYPVGSDR